MRDLANVQSPQLGGTNIGGVLSIVGGDYALVDGEQLIRKLIIRRLLSTPGDFFHIPNYGCGIQVKQPLPGGGLVRLKASIARQLLLEPDITAVTVAISQTTNTLTIIVNATMARSGSLVTVSMLSPIGQG